LTDRGSATTIRDMRPYAIALLLLSACSPSAPGMVSHAAVPHPEDPRLAELARIESRPDRRALLVVYPRDACSGSASTVLMDEDGHFLGAIAPGTAALLDVPADARRIVSTSAVEITAPPGTPPYRDHVHVPPSPDGLVLRSHRVSSRQCTRTGQYAGATRASKQELESMLSETEVHWLEPHVLSGQAWLDQNGPRVRELLASGR
jgi:hypothetical protein